MNHSHKIIYVIITCSCFTPTIAEVGRHPNILQQMNGWTNRRAFIPAKEGTNWYTKTPGSISGEYAEWGEKSQPQKVPYCTIPSVEDIFFLRRQKLYEWITNLWCWGSRREVQRAGGMGGCEDNRKEHAAPGTVCAWTPHRLRPSSDCVTLHYCKTLSLGSTGHTAQVISVLFLKTAANLHLSHNQKFD